MYIDGASSSALRLPSFLSCEVRFLDLISQTPTGLLFVLEECPSKYYIQYIDKVIARIRSLSKKRLEKVLECSGISLH